MNNDWSEDLKHNAMVNLGSGRLSINDITRIARDNAAVSVTEDSVVLQRVERAHAYVRKAIDDGQSIYGVTTRFGAMADTQLSEAAAIELQNKSLWIHKTGAGRVLPRESVRAAMVVRMNSHLRGYSGVRLELVRRLALFINKGVTPRVREFGSIGASGDLVPLNYICGCIVGAPAGFEVDYQGETLDAREALSRIGLEALQLEAKEGLAMMNGTSMSTGMAALYFYDARVLLAAALAFHALAIQALGARVEYFHPFIQQVNPHPGQQWVARTMSSLLEGSKLVSTLVGRGSQLRTGALIQDRYSVRCIPQYLGPIVEELVSAEQQIEIEANGCSDNPLIDAEHNEIYHGGNFLGEYTSRAVDRLRFDLAMLAKHVDAQIALLMAPEFSNGLSPSLVGNRDNPANMGLKGLQLTGNSIVPLLLHRGASLSDRFPTYAEQFNQNLNSQSLGSCLLCSKSIREFRTYIAVALLVAIQAVDLRTRLLHGSYDPRPFLSQPTLRVYDSVRAAINSPTQAERPYIWNDDEQSLDRHIELLVEGLSAKDGCGSALDKIVAGSLSTLLN